MSEYGYVGYRQSIKIRNGKWQIKTTLSKKQCLWGYERLPFTSQEMLMSMILVSTVINRTFCLNVPAP